MSEKSMVAIVKGRMPPDQAEIDRMVREAVNLIGGLSGKIKLGGHVVIKPNLFAPYPPPISVDRQGYCKHGQTVSAKQEQSVSLLSRVSAWGRL